jgi:hypothetical protein
VELLPVLILASIAAWQVVLLLRARRALFKAKELAGHLERLFRETFGREISLRRALRWSEEQRVEQRMLHERERLVYPDIVHTAVRCQSG